MRGWGAACAFTLSNFNQAVTLCATGSCWVDVFVVKIQPRMGKLVDRSAPQDYQTGLIIPL